MRCDLAAGPEYGLLVGLPGDAISKLQLIQKMAARVVSRTKINEHVTPVLMGLFWLPVQQRIQYKILLLSYKAQHGLCPWLHLWATASLSTVTPFEVSHGRTQTDRAKNCKMGRACLQQGCPGVVECASSLYKMCWLPELIQVHTQNSPLAVCFLLSIILCWLNSDDIFYFFKVYIIFEGHLLSRLTLLSPFISITVP